MNYGLPKWMVLPEAKPMPVSLLLLATKDSFCDGTIEMSRGKAR
jgi:hypothetical protein